MARTRPAVPERVRPRRLPVPVVLPDPPDPETLLDKRSGRASTWRRLKGGSVPLFSDGREVLKLFPANERRFADAEWATLVHLSGRLPIATPEPIELIDTEQWIVVRMTHLPGRPARSDWSRRSAVEHDRLSRQLGECVRALHDLPPPEDPVLVAPDGGFEAFLCAQRERFATRTAELGASADQIARELDYLDEWFDGREPAPREVLLHTELMPEHVFVREGAAGPELCGMLDFEPSMVGDPRYDLPGLGWWWSGGDPAKYRAVCEAYGGFGDGRPAPSPEELMVLSLLHRYYHPLKWRERVQGHLDPEAPLGRLAQGIFTP